jgi:hypothetical protein
MPAPSFAPLGLTALALAALMFLSVPHPQAVAPPSLPPKLWMVLR